MSTRGFSPNPAIVAAVESALLARGGRTQGDEIVFSCVFPERHRHGDAGPSASYNRTKRVWICRVCAATGGFLNLAARLAIDVPRLPKAASRLQREIRRRRWEIRDATGALIATHHRIDYDRGDPKRWWERGGMRGLSGLPSSALPLYGTERLASLPAGTIVILAEGEPAADALRAAGLDAVASVTGAAATPSRASLNVLRSYDVVLWPDDDRPGRDHMTRIATQLQDLGVAARVLTWSPPEAATGVKPVGNGADAADFFAVGGTIEELLARVKAVAAAATTNGTVLVAAESLAYPDLRATLDAVRAFSCRYVHFTNAHQAVAVALWVAHTHAVEAAECSPFLAITAAEMRSGKSRTLDVLNCLAARPWRAIVPSDAVLFRKIDFDRPTLLLDEADAIFGRKAGEYEGLRAILNAGNRRGTSVPRVVPQGKTMTLVEFSVFCPKAIAGIGALPATVADRAIPIRMQRRARGEPVEKFRQREAEALARPIREALAYHTAATRDALRDADPDVPDELDDRAQDSWEPLLALADAAGGAWPIAARRAALELHATRDADDESLGVRLLGDVRHAFAERDADRLTTADLLSELLRIEESPWADMRGRPLGPHGLARLLRPYGIAPRVLRIGTATPRGYAVDSFVDAFQRYLAPVTITARSATPQQATHNGPDEANEAGLGCDVADDDAVDEATHQPPGDLADGRTSDTVEIEL
jgi:hypothetical protein